MKYLLLLMLPLLVSWKGNEFNWGMYRGKIPPKSEYAAQTHVRLNYKWWFDSKKELHVGCEVVFDQKKSWVKVKSDELLLHEIGHYEIALIHQSVFYILASKITDYSTADDQMKDICRMVNKGMEDMQIQYDKETGHSLNASEQTRWKEYIKSLLK